MFETRRDLGNLTQRMADLEGVVEILYNSHQDRVKGNTIIHNFIIVVFISIIVVFISIIRGCV